MNDMTVSENYYIEFTAADIVSAYHQQQFGAQQVGSARP